VVFEELNSSENNAMSLGKDPGRFKAGVEMSFAMIKKEYYNRFTRHAFVFRAI